MRHTALQQIFHPADAESAERKREAWTDPEGREQGSVGREKKCGQKSGGGGRNKVIAADDDDVMCGDGNDPAAGIYGILEKKEMKGEQEDEEEF